MKKIIISTFIVFVSLFCLSASASFSQDDWKFKKNIEVPALGEVEYVQLKLDREVSGVNNNFKDVRIISEDLDEVPYQLIVERATTENSYSQSSVVNQSVDSSGRLMFVLDLGKSGVLHSRININSSSKNFKRQVSVYAADSLLSHVSPGWELLTGNGYIFKFTDTAASFSAGQGVVNYPSNTSRYLRVVIGSGIEGALSLSQARVYKYEVSAAKEEENSFVTEVHENSDERTTEIIVDLGASGWATEKIQLSSDDVNFNRRVTVQSSNDRQNWRKIGQGYIFSVNTPSFTGTNISISYPENTSRYIRVVVFNNDDKAVSFQNEVVLSGVIRSIVFEANPDVKYSLFYGNDKAISPQYDLARFFKYLDLGGFSQAKLGDQKNNPSYVAPPEPTVPFTEKYPDLLNAVLVVLVVILGIFIFIYLKKHKEL